MKYTELKDEQQKKLSELSEKVGLFWAFNQKQFEEGKANNPAKKYTSIGMGGYLPSANVKEWLLGMKAIDKWFKEAKSLVKKEEAILYELNNHECFYTNDIEDVVELFKSVYTIEEIKAVYLKYGKREPYLSR